MESKICGIKDSFTLSRDDLSFLEISDFFELKINRYSIETLRKKINIRKNYYNLTKMIELPFLIKTTEDFYCFEKQSLEPNFITLNKVESNIAVLNNLNKKNLNGKILLIPQADPGYDWIFSLGITGLVTKYGGANSHMAIRAAENNVLAGLGVGEKNFNSYVLAKRIELNSEKQFIRVIN